jgi:hypothetical protein
MQQLRGEFVQKPAGKRTSDITPGKRRHMTARRQSVSREVVSLENRKRILEEFVAVRSPERYEQIISERQRRAERASP